MIFNQAQETPHWWVDGWKKSLPALGKGLHCCQSNHTVIINIDNTAVKVPEPRAQAMSTFHPQHAPGRGSKAGLAWGRCWEEKAGPGVPVTDSARGHLRLMSPGSAQPRGKLSPLESL